MTLTLSSSETKSTEEPNLTRDNAINSLDVYIFNTGDSNDPNYGTLDMYTRVTENMDDIKLQTTTGPKKICVIANPKDDMSGDYIRNLSQMKDLVASLQDETYGNLTMYGETDAVLQVQSSESVTVSRLISRINIKSIKTDFDGTPYKGMTLGNCSLYLINVHSGKLLCDGTPVVSDPVLNKGELNSADVEGMSQPDLLMDKIDVAINDEGYSTSHYLYCYANETETINDATMLVLEAQLNGTTYYYPVPVNQTGYGYNEENGHFGIKRNTQYSYSLTITRPGSLEPDVPVDPSALTLNIVVEEWDVVPEFNKVF